MTQSNNKLVERGMFRATASRQPALACGRAAICVASRSLRDFDRAQGCNG